MLAKAGMTMGSAAHGSLIAYHVGLAVAGGRDLALAVSHQAGEVVAV